VSGSAGIVDRGTPPRWPGIAWLDSFPLASTLARRSRRPILVGVFDPDVPASTMMDRTNGFESRIARFVSEWFVAVRVDGSEGLDPAWGRLAPWSPGLLHLDPDGRRFRSSIGFLPPGAFLAELRIALGQLALLDGRTREALEWFERASESDSALAAEALYWAGAAAYRDGAGIAGLRDRRDELRARFPSSPWSERSELEEPVGSAAGEPSARGSWAEAWRTVRKAIATNWKR